VLRIALNLPKARREYLIANGRRSRSWALQRELFSLETHVPGMFVARGTSRFDKTSCACRAEGSISIELMHQYLDRF
jgi:hypothetical protein